jgi:hypothetical protein
MRKHNYKKCKFPLKNDVKIGNKFYNNPLPKSPKTKHFMNRKKITQYLAFNTGRPITTTALQRT